MVRRTAKLVAEALLVASGTAQRKARRSGYTSAVLAFHNVIADRELHVGDTSLHMRRRHFADFVHALREHVEIVGLQELINSPNASGLRVAITFDDAYHGAIHNALPLLAAENIPATVFTAPAMLSAASTWWDEAAGEHRGAIPEHVRDTWLDGDSAGRADAIRASKPNDWPTVQLPESYRIIDSDQLLAAVRSGPFTLASHTWSHVCVSALASMAARSAQAADELHTELAKPLEWLRATGVPTLPMLAYPYGRYNEAAMHAVSAAGYSAAFRVDGGAVQAGEQSETARCFAIPRINIPSAMTAAGMLLRLSGLRT